MMLKWCGLFVDAHIVVTGVVHAIYIAQADEPYLCDRYWRTPN